MSVKRKLLFVFFLAIFLAGSYFAYVQLHPFFLPDTTPAQTTVPPPPPPPVVTPYVPPSAPEPAVQIPEEEEPDEEEPDPGLVLPVGRLVLTRERTEYVNKSLTLVIPALDKVIPVHDGTSEAVLHAMEAGLYEYAQLPGWGTRNVSLAGHRNTSRGGIITDNAPFYYVDLLKEGDYLYLHDYEWVYRYEWESCFIIEQDDWSVIRTTEYSVVTITSCHPIGISNQRIVVRGRLVEILPYQPGFDFIPSRIDNTATSAD